MLTKTTLVTVFLFATSAFAQVAREAPDLVPSGKGWGEAVEHAPKREAKNGGGGGGGKTSTCTNGMCYHGGPVLSGTVNIYYVWYGNWSAGGSNSAATESLLNTLIYDMGGSRYENINTTYSVNSSNTITGLLNLAGSTSDNYSQGTSFGDAGVQAAVVNAITRALPFDTTGVYFVLTSSDVNETSGFCTKYCGWHSHANLATSKGKGDIKFAFVGNPDRCPSACESQTISPNGNSGGDAMASIVAHEQLEAVSDPDLNAWYDNRGNENADKCAWTYGSVSKLSNGAQYNLTGRSGTNYLIQRNWVNAGGGYCAMSY